MSTLAPMTLAGVALATVLAGCAGEPLPSAWVDVATTSFQSNGETGRIDVPAAQPGAALALRATTAPGVCFQLSSVVDGIGHTVLDQRSAGAYCRDCDLRTSVAVEAGVFVLPTDAGRFEPTTGLSLRFARVDCTTLTPLTAPNDSPLLQVAVQSIETVPDVATIDLRFLIADSSILFGNKARQNEVMAFLEQELASAGLVPRLVDVHSLDALPRDTRFHAGDPTELAAFIANAPPKAETTIDVVFGACLLYDDPIFGPANPVDGFTPRIPGGAGPADAVFLPGLDCFAPGSTPRDVPARTQAHVLAHELGHYLGLYHSVETDGFQDQLDDTDADNIMFANPGVAKAIGFSVSQGYIMRLSPAVRASK